MATHDDNSDLAPDLGRTRLLTGLSMLFERFWPLALPSMIAASAFLTLSWAGLFRSIPDGLRLAFLAVLCVLLVGSLWPLRRLRIPGSSEIDTRIEDVNALKNQPVMAQIDRPSGSPDDFANALWREHQRRMAASLEGVRSSAPSPRTYDHDGWALRALPGLGLFVAFAFSFGSAGGRVSDMWNGMAAVPPVPPRIDAWVTPPKYTGKPPLFLTKDQGQELSAPDGQPVTIADQSVLTVRIASGQSDGFGLMQDGVPLAPPKTDKAANAPIASAAVLNAVIGKDGIVTLSRGGAPVSAWTFKIIKDAPPVIAFTADPAASSNGALTLAYSILDDYGAASAVAALKLANAKADARPLYEMPEIALTLPRRNAAGLAKTVKDLTEHPLAGNAFEITLRAQDGAGQSAVSPVRTFVLPERDFVHPLARSLQEERRLLAADANAKRLVEDYLDALVIRPDETLNNASHYLGITTARNRLAYAKTDDELRDLVAYLWEMAKAIDKSAMSDAERRLRQAEERLAQALENGASDAEIDKLLQELRQAMNDYMKQLVEDGEKNPQTAQNDQTMKELRSSELEKMLDKLQDLSKQGKKDEARQLLNRLQDMMKNLQARKGKSGKGGDGKSQMEGKLNELGKMLRDQQKLLDDTFKKNRERGGEQAPGGDEQGSQPGQGKNGEGQSGDGKNGQDPPGSGGDLAGRQNDLSSRLQGLMDGLKGLGLDPGQELSDAGKAMGRAGKKLGEGNPGEATGDQTDALESLRKGAESLMDQMKQAMGEQGGGQQPGGQRAGDDRDPLGRPRATEGPDMGQSTKVPDEIDAERAREILEAIRKRLGDALSPEAEKNYLQRLLQFE